MTAPEADAAGERASQRAAWATVDLGALERNLTGLRRQVAPAAVLAVVKADAYGHGAIPVARALERAGIDWLGVGETGEGERLRRAGVETPILVMGVAESGLLGRFRSLRLTPTLSSLDQLVAWSAAARGGDRLAVHLKVDTGMTRLGIAPEELPAALERLRSAPLELGGLLSHLAEADVPESPRNRLQLESFEAVLAALTDEERQRVVLHLANSGGGLHQPATRFHLVRLGLAVYGLDPARRIPGLEPVLGIAGRVVLVRQVPAGTRAGYGGSWQAERPSTLAVVPIGYGDGYPWRLSNRGEGLVGGRRVPVAGRVSMDMTLLDVTGAGAAVGDEAVLLGRQGDEQITAFELAERAGTVVWEVLCGFGLRLPRRLVGVGSGTDD